MKRKSLTIILMVPFLLCSFLLSQISSTYALENETISDLEYSELQYEIIKDDETERVVHYLDSSSEGTVTFDKKTKKIEIKEIFNGVENTITFYNKTRKPRSVYSPWGYSKKGNSYTLTAVINGKVVLKTRTRTSKNAANIDRFTDAIDDMVSTEWSITWALGFNVVGSLLAAFATGGLSIGGLIGSLTSMGAPGGVIDSAKHLNTLTARARNAYHAL